MVRTVRLNTKLFNYISHPQLPIALGQLGEDMTVVKHCQNSGVKSISFQLLCGTWMGDNGSGQDYEKQNIYEALSIMWRLLASFS